MEQIKEGQDSQDDFDIRALLVKCFRFLKKYILLIAIFFLAGLLIGILVYVKTPKVYSSTLLLRPVILTKSEQLTALGNLNNMLAQKQYVELASRFNCDPSVLKKINAISGHDNVGEIGSKNSILTVRIMITDPSIVPTVQKGIINALENSHFVKEKLETQRSSFRTMIDITSSEINRLDSMRSAIEKNIYTPKQSSPSIIIDPSRINITNIGLHQKLLQLKDSLDLLVATNVVQDFYVPTEPEMPEPVKTIGLGAATGLVLGFFVSLCLFILQSVKPIKRANTP